MAKYARLRTQGHEEPTVNLTPLIDVVFVILIMFIVIAPLLEIDRIELAKAQSGPQEHATVVTEKSRIILQVRRDNSIWLNDRQVDQNLLPKALKELKMQHPKERPQLFHDKSAYFGTYQMVKNSLEEAGFDELDLILKPS